ncbi:caspase-8 isoform X1 [Pleurodeles waltl]|uniref:caspase-8 isoform X1 n=2 Tax=Pleurodeles waltl TaxID=8319 RepID=UPI0037098EB4
MEFHQRLHKISEALDTEDVQALKFLCLGQIPLRQQQEIRDAKDLFLKLQENGFLEEGDLFFLRELLFRIKRIDILQQELRCSKEEIERALQLPGQAKVSQYRHMLFILSENTTEKALKHLKLLINELPQNKLGNNTTMLEMFVGMEKKGILGEKNLDFLKKKCENVDKGLVKIIEEYQQSTAVKENGGNGGTMPLCTSDVPGLTAEPLQVDLVYKMSSRPRGVCLILNNYDFAKARAEVHKLRNLRDRHGTAADAAALSKVFSLLHFKIEESKDLTAEQIQKVVQSYGTVDHKESDCFVCCILSHGDKGTILGTDGKQVAIRELTACFTARNCRSLAGKPKVFFIQACQGESYHRGVMLETDTTRPPSQYDIDANTPTECIPEEADFLVGMATMKNYVSYRSPTEGTWYIQSLCQHLNMSCPRGDDILTILTRVNQEVSAKYDQKNKGKQMPQPSFTLRKRLLFPMN